MKFIRITCLALTAYLLSAAMFTDADFERGRVRFEHTITTHGRVITINQVEE
jgi:hypothetical protein